MKKKDISLTDFILLNPIITGQNNKKIQENQKLEAYDKSTILHILDHQKKHGMNNSQLASRFKFSHHTAAEWKPFLFEKLSLICSYFRQ